VRITHTDIEQLVADLRGWVERKKNPDSQFVRTGYRGAIKLSIYSFHKDEDLERSQRYLDDMMNRLKLRNVRRREEAEQLLASYTDWWGRAGIRAAQTRLRINLPLGEGLALGGEVSRIDLGMDSVGYKGILLGVQDHNWSRQLRMPVLQLAIASRLGREPSEVGVGVQELDGTSLQVVQYSQGEMQEATREVCRLVRAAQRMLEE
jgi:hypothetical protein